MNHIPTDTELIHRMHRAARIVVMAHDNIPEDLVTTGTVSALAVWEIFTGIDDDDAAMAYARRVAAPGWPSEFLAAS